MTEKEKYLKSLKKELDAYTKQLALIQADFKGKAGEDIENISQSLQNIQNEAIAAYGQLKSASAKEWEPLKALTREAFNTLKESIDERVNTYTNQIEAGYEAQLECVAKYVRKHPFKSLFLATGAGFILGKILK